MNEYCRKNYPYNKRAGDYQPLGKGQEYSSTFGSKSAIIQLATQGVFNHEIAKRLGVSRPTVQLWRERFLALRLAGLEKDAPRPGRLPGLVTRKLWQSSMPLSTQHRLMQHIGAPAAWLKHRTSAKPGFGVFGQSIGFMC